MSSFNTNRRDFLKSGLLAAGSVLLLPACSKNYTPWLFFTPEEAKCMTAICEQIIPADEHGPGATYAGVIYYIDKQLQEVFHWEQVNYRKGLQAIQESSLELHSSLYQELNQTQQREFLKQMEKNQLPESHWNGLNQSSLFRTMVQHSMQGFYGPPRHGGNKNYISYKLMNIEYPYVVGQNRYASISK